MKRKVGKELEEGSKKRKEEEVTTLCFHLCKTTDIPKKHAKHTIHIFKREKNWVYRRPDTEGHLRRT